MSAHRRDYVTIRLPRSREEKIPAEAKNLARSRTRHLIARIEYAPLTDLLADAWLQGVTDGAQVSMKETAAGRTPADKGEEAMTISISVSVNGNYKVPVTVKRGAEEATTEVVSGRGHEGPNVKHIPYYHGTDGDVVVTVGKEEQDNGEEAAAAAA